VVALMCSWATGARNGRCDLGGGRHAGNDGRRIYTEFQPLPQGDEARSVHSLLDREPGAFPSWARRATMSLPKCFITSSAAALDEHSCSIKKRLP
jgi:hypothetical protein